MRFNTYNCPDCGEFPVNHRIARWTAVSDSATMHLFAPVDPMSRRLGTWFNKGYLDRLSLPLFRLLAAMRLGTLRTEVAENDTHRTKLLWDAAARKGIRMYQFRMLDRPDGTNFFTAYARGAVRTFEGLPRPQRGASPSLAWMDNKAVLKAKFLSAGIPMAQGGSARTFKEALAIFKKIGPPAITKPHIGSRSRHTTVHVMNEADLKKGFDKAKQLSPWIIVEQELQGFLFRVLLVNKKVAAITRREPPHVIGDGKHTVRELAEQENKNPRRRGPTFHALQFDKTAEAELARQGLTWDSVIKKGEMATLHTYISRFYGGSTSNFMERAHPENIKLFEHIGETLDDSLVGVDFIIRDMERSWREQKLCGVIECNSLPNIDLHHDVLYGENQDIAGMLLDLAFPEKGN